MLDVRGLSLAIAGRPILDDVSLSIGAGETVALVGESGSGKSMTALSIMRLLPRGASLAGHVGFAGENLLHAGEPHMEALRGDEIGMVFQEPMTALNPVMTVGRQIAEGFALHTDLPRREVGRRVRAMLDRVGLEGVALDRYPHELSGGQRQRVVIAMACALRPRLLIADEPTTALDVTLQGQILALLRSFVDDTRTGLLLVSHDLAVVANVADRIVVMRHGRVVEAGGTSAVLRKPQHAYTRALLEASTHVPERRPRPTGRPLLEARDVVRDYALPRRSPFGSRPRFRAVDRVSLEVAGGESVGLVGESGCGKSTLARVLLGLDAAEGTVTFEGHKVGPHADMTAVRRDVQIVFQDPYGSFDPRHRVERIVGEPLHLAGLSPADRRGRIVEALRNVELPGEDVLTRFPHEFSGGQRQRIAIARALVVRPKLVIADEPVSALDVSIRAQVLDLFARLQDRFGLAYLFITHDLAMVRAVCDRVLVMRAGRIVERGRVTEVFANPQHGYTRTLLAAAPNLGRSLA